MNTPRQITLDVWQQRCADLQARGLYPLDADGGLRRHVRDGNTRLEQLKFDNSTAALRLWDLLLSENARLHAARQAGKKIFGTMKDLGTAAVMAYSFENVVAFYPDGAWWTPCLMECNEGLFDLAARLGLDESICPVRAMVAAFVNAEHFPRPDLLICSAGAVCDDFSATAQRLEQLGFPIHWWQMPRRRRPDADEVCIALPNGLTAPAAQVAFVRCQLAAVKAAMEAAAGTPLTDAMLHEGIGKANRFREVLAELRLLAYTAKPCPLGALEMLIAEMLALHYCSDYTVALSVLDDLLATVKARVKAGNGVLADGAARVFWVNPVADLRAMNLLEECGGRLCGSEYLFSHTLDPIAELDDPLEALTRTALADPMAGSTQDRAERICDEMRRFGAQGAVISRIPGASHCACEGTLIAETIRQRLNLPVIEIEVPTLCDAAMPAIRTRMEALIETIQRSHA